MRRDEKRLLSSSLTTLKWGVISDVLYISREGCKNMFHPRSPDFRSHAVGISHLGGGGSPFGTNPSHG
jgi:hypothetical protein